MEIWMPLRWISICTPFCLRPLLKSLDYKTYHFANWSAHPDKEVAQTVSEWVERLQEKENCQILILLDLIYTLIPMSANKFTCNKNVLYERVHLWMLHVLLNRSATMALNERFCFKSSLHKREKNGPSTYCTVGNNILETYARDEDIAETSADIM